MAVAEQGATQREQAPTGEEAETGRTARWSTASMALHWAGAALLVGLVAAGSTLGDLDTHSDARLWLSRLHTVGGVSLVVLTAARLWMRRRTPRPAPLGLTPLHQKGVGLVHALLYAALFGLGVTGLATARTSSHWHEYLVGDVAGAPDTSQLPAHGVHETLVGLVLVLVGLHVVGVLVDQVRRGGTLRRMLPFRS